MIKVLLLGTFAFFAIVIMDERNLFSAQVIYQTEPFLTIGTCQIQRNRAGK